MFYCPKCSNSFDISKTPNNKQLQYGGDLVEKILTDDNLSEDYLNNIDIDKLADTDAYEELSNTQKKQLRDIIQNGGKLIDHDVIIKNIFNNKSLSKEELNTIDINKLIKTTSYKKLSKTKQKVIFNYIQDHVSKKNKLLVKQKDTTFNENNIVYFVCKNCKYNRMVNKKTLIYSKTESEYYNENFNIKHRIHSNILPITRKYICPNDKCKSHKDIGLREASIVRLPNSYAINYICHSCKTSWTP